MRMIAIVREMELDITQQLEGEMYVNAAYNIYYILYIYYKIWRMMISPTTITSRLPRDIIHHTRYNIHRKCTATAFTEQLRQAFQARPVAVATMGS